MEPLQTPWGGENVLPSKLTCPGTGLKGLVILKASWKGSRSGSRAANSLNKRHWPRSNQFDLEGRAAQTPAACLGFKNRLFPERNVAAFPACGQK